MHMLEIDGRFQMKRQRLTIYNAVTMSLQQIICALNEILSFVRHLSSCIIPFVNVLARITMTYAHSGLLSENAKREYRVFEMISFYSTT